MELRVLEYFLAVCQEQNISKAAETLNLTQPTLSRQLQDLEKELKKTLFIRGKKIILTEEGRILKKRASEIVEMAKKTRDEIMTSEQLAGTIDIGAAESDAIRFISRVAMQFQQSNPNVDFNFVSGDLDDVLDRLDSGQYNFDVICGPADGYRYNYIKLKHSDVMAVLMKKDAPLAQKSFITASDLYDVPLLLSRQQIKTGFIRSLLDRSEARLNIKATFNLLHNGSLMVSEGLGYCLTFDNLVNVEGTDLIYKPFKPTTLVESNLIWKKDATLSKVSREFLKLIQTEIEK